MRDRTADLLRARQALSQLSYSPKVSSVSNHEACQVNTQCVLIKAWYPRRIIVPEWENLLCEWCHNDE